MKETSEHWKWGEEPPTPKPEPFHQQGERHLCCGYDGNMQAFASGDWVRYTDYEKLKAEVERLEINDYKNLSMRIEIDKLNAKINRLVKAGDKMVLCIDGDYNYQMPCVQAWNAAKEGKPSV